MMMMMMMMIMIIIIIIIIIKNEKIRVRLCENAAGALYVDDDGTERVMPV